MLLIQIWKLRLRIWRKLSNNNNIFYYFRYNKSINLNFYLPSSLVFSKNSFNVLKIFFFQKPNLLVNMGQTLASELRSSKYKKKKEIDLSNKGIQELPGAVSNLKSCTRLDVSHNDLISLPDEIGLMPVIEILLLNNNRITSLPSEIGDLSTLKELHVQNNNLFRYPLTPSIGKLKNLTVLNISSNQIDDLSPHIAQCENLVHLDISDNAIKSIPREFGNLKHLETLYANKNRLQVLPATIGQCKSLKTLILSQNAIVKLPDELANCTLLEVLHVNINSIKSLNDNFTQLSNLVDLNLSDNSLLSELPPLSCFPKLKKLGIDNLKIENIEGIESCQALEDLSLRDNLQISSFYSTFGSVVNLKRLGIYLVFRNIIHL